jgi:hypothetical protein
MKYIIYQITNLINNKIYIGYHSTKNLDDSYMGSGKRLNASINKYGIHNFKKDILYVFTDKNEALQKEMELVNEDFVKREDTYNMKVGGEGGWDHTWESNRRPEIIEVRREGQKKAVKEGRLKTFRDWTTEQRKQFNGMGFKGRTHSEESRFNISKNNGALLGEETMQTRLKDYLEIEKKRGYINKLASMWNISHTQTSRFIRGHFKNN